MILVVGATEDVGSTVTRMLLRRGKTVRILAPARTNCQELIEAGAQPVTTDLRDEASLAASCRGAHAVICASDAEDGADDARAAGVEHFVYLSAFAGDINSPAQFLAQKATSEAYLQASGVPYTIIAANAFMEAWPFMLVGRPAIVGIPVHLAGDGNRRHSFISSANVAQFIVAVVDNAHALNRRLAVGGPEALSLRDVVAIYEWLLGRRIEVRTVRPGQPIPGLPAALWDTAAGFDIFDSVQDSTETARGFGIRLTSFEVLAKRMLAASERDC
jgi:uncharacterized protein YbjT (DUF2867 family)